YPNGPQIKLAQKMLSLTKFGKEKGKAFFCNSGTEANEAAIKFARKYFFSKGEKNRVEIITFANSFHGRTYGALAATGQEKLKIGFGPMPAGFKHVEWNNAEELKKSVGKNTAAIMLEPVAAEGGILMPSKKFIKTINELKKSGCLVIADEIQIGVGRCGEISCSEFYGISADITTWAKAIGGGLPLGMALMSEKIAKCLQPGDHGTTFGGNPVSCAAGLAALEIISKPKFLKNVRERSAQLRAGLEALAKKHKFLGEIRGEGLLLGIETQKPVADLISACRNQGLLVLRSGANILRLLPPLTITKGDAKEALGKLEAAFTIFL
ncbi:MAG: aminotransferase class III-fold pyridoxal phosphate-dependent enzyme, partial [Fibromonadales bacterium]|nr:aminotransferase class III-fold pyridoxal phosphate-dependent enzyme [Fibromonadales bacterium]